MGWKYIDLNIIVFFILNFEVIEKYILVFIGDVGISILFVDMGFLIWFSFEVGSVYLGFFLVFIGVWIMEVFRGLYCFFCFVLRSV